MASSAVEKTTEIGTAGIETVKSGATTVIETAKDAVSSHKTEEPAEKQHEIIGGISSQGPIIEGIAVEPKETCNKSLTGKAAEVIGSSIETAKSTTGEIVNTGIETVKSGVDTITGAISRLGIFLLI